jgi:PAS domain S-box-containing protein
MCYLKDELYSLVKSNNQIFDFIQDSALDGLWYWNLDNFEDEWMNEKFWTTLGYDPAEMPHKASAWQDIIHPDDLKLATENFHLHLKDPNVPYDNIVRYTHKEGHTVWVRCRGMVVHNDEGKAYRMLGAHTDVTTLKKKELLLESCNSAAKIGFWDIDFIKGEIIWSSETRRIHEVDEDFVPDLEKGIEFYEEGWSRDTIQIILAEAMEDLQERDVELRLVTQKGNALWVRAILVPVGDENGKCIKMYGTFQDIHDRKLAQLKLNKERRKLSYIIESTGVGTWEGRYHGEKLAINERFAQILGYELEELPDSSDVLWKLLVHPDHDEKLDLALGDCAEGRTEVFKMDTLLRHKEGHFKWVRLRAKYYSGVDGKSKLFYGTMTDIDQEHKLLLQQKSFIVQSPTCIALLDERLDIITVSEKWKALLGIQEEVLTGFSIHQILSNQFKPLIELLESSLIANEPQEGELEVFSEEKDTSLWIKWNFSPWYNAASQERGVIMHLDDVTQDKHLKMQLQTSESKFRGSFEAAGVGMAMVDHRGSIEEVNEKLCEILGYSRDELLELSFANITHPEDLEEEIDLLKQLVTGEINRFRREKRYLNKSGEVVYAILTVSTIPGNEVTKVSFVSQVVDITDLKKAETKLAEAVAKYEVILSASEHVLIFSSDLEGTIQSVNVGCKHLLGYTEDELVGKKKATVFHNEEQINEMETSFEQIFGKPTKAIDGIISLVKEHDGPITQELVYSSKVGVPMEMILTLSPIKSEGQLIGFLGVALDISDVKKAEKEIKDLLLISEDQNARLKNFAHIVSHNLRSHSGNIDFLMDLLIQDHPDLSEGDVVPMLKQASVNLKEAIAHLNEVAVINTSILDKMHFINLADSVSNALKSVRALAMKNDVKIINEVKNPSNILAIHAYLDSIVLNFITNGIKYSSPDRESYIKISSSEGKDYTILRFEDNGLGIDLKRHGNKLFGMYKTFHKHNESRGIGLFITKNQIEALGGRVEVISEVDQGTTFSIYLKNHEEN